MAKHARSSSSEDVSKGPSKHARADSDGHIYNNKDDVFRHPTTRRAKEIDADPPLAQLEELLGAQKKDHTVRNVVHWFRSKDLREEDNRALHAASQKAKEGNGKLLTMYLYSPKDMEWHGTSPARSDFLLQSLDILRRQLQAKHIPLAIVEASERAQKVERVLEFLTKWDVSHVYANFEYEVDELRRDIKLAKQLQKGDKDVSFEVLHDQTVVEPLKMKTGTGSAMKVFTPYHKAWLAEVARHPELLDLVDPPEGNDKEAKEEFKDLFEGQLPELPENKQFVSGDEKKRIRELWPAGNDAGMKRLEEFLNKKVSDYHATRSNPGADSSSRLSPYFSSGIVSVRQVLVRVKSFNKNKAFDSGNSGVAAWVREIVFREFYRHILVLIPHNAMNLPQNLKFDNVKWEEDEEGWKKWCEGTTGVPLVDAGMRQLNTQAWMHNRARMNTSSYLTCNLLIDYRKGERYFAEHLIDWDLANNTQGWEPSYTVFNPLNQAEKNDPDGDYIRRWVPELKNVKGKAVFAPWERLSKAEFEKLGYPRPHVDYKETKDRAIARFKRDLADADA
ncbi:hypothetical protein MBLNU459_g6619t1 [Dothideomycetes sp. NU459]